MASEVQPIGDLDAYRRTLAEIRILRGARRSAGDDRRLAMLEAAAADFAERLRGSSLERGRPPQGDEPE